MELFSSHNYKMNDDQVIDWDELIESANNFEISKLFV